MAKFELTIISAVWRPVLTAHDVVGVQCTTPSRPRLHRVSVCARSYTAATDAALDKLNAEFAASDSDRRAWLIDTSLAEVRQRLRQNAAQRTSALRRAGQRGRFVVKVEGQGYVCRGGHTSRRCEATTFRYRTGALAVARSYKRARAEVIALA